MKAKAPFMMPAKSSGSSCSAMAVDRATSAKSTVAKRRSPATGGAGASALPQFAQNFAASEFSVPHFGQVCIAYPLDKAAQTATPFARDLPLIVALPKAANKLRRAGPGDRIPPRTQASTVPSTTSCSSAFST
jgi:hypothetical protein